MKQLVTIVVLIVLLSVSSFAQKKAAAERSAPLVENPDNDGGLSLRKRAPLDALEPLYTPSRFSDAPRNFPNQLYTNPLRNAAYDYQSKFHFGFVFTVTALDYNITSAKDPQTSSSNVDVPKDNIYQRSNFFVDVSGLSPAFGVAALADIRIDHHFSARIQLGPIFGARTLSFYDYNLSPEKPPLVHTMEIESVIVEMPMLAKYKMERRNTALRPYVLGGITPRWDVSANRTLNQGKGVYISNKPFDIALTAGIGLDMYLDYFKFAVEVKYSHGLINAMSNTSLPLYENYPNSIESMMARTFAISIIFE